MKQIICGIALAAIIALSCPQGHAVITTISRAGCDIVLTWPSVPGQVFIVQFRDTLDPGSSWVTLTNGFPAAVGATTTFVHPEVLPGCGGQMQAMAAGGSPTPQLTPQERAERIARARAEAERMLKWLMAQLEEAIARFRAEREAWAKNPELREAARREAADGPMMMESSAGCCGFYRVFIPSPVATVDIHEVAQNSVTNQLDVLANDYDPEEFGFLISSVSAAGHGAIQYNDNASIFRYTPTAGYAGTDSFTYSITNEVGGVGSKTAWVFVNESGNNHPSAPPLEFTLATNESQFSFPILTNAADPNSDALSLAVIIPPTKGTAVTNANGTLTYTRTSGYPARDEFCTVLTDGRGGFVKRAVVVLPPDTDGDGMPDEWEVVNGLNPGAADGLSDPDGDGIPNLAEYKLRTNPNVADNPLHLQTIAVGQSFSNFARVPLALNPAMDKQPIRLLMAGESTLSELRQGADSSWYVTWDTGYLPNDTNSLSLAFQFNPDAQLPTPSTVTGPSQSARVTNEVIFNQLNSEFSDIWFIDISFPYASADFRIELYDEDGSGLVYFEGTTTEGNVQGGWDLTFGGQQIAFGNLMAAVYAAPAGTGGVPPVGNPANKPKARRWFAKQIAGGVGDKFVVAWGWDNYSSSFNDQRDSLMLDGVINIIGNPGLDDEYLLLPGANIPFGGAFRYDTDVDKELLKLALTSTEAGNFFWFGHGSKDAIQGNAKKSAIDAGDIENWLGNKKHRSKPPKYSYNNKHPYRLVILNGCDTYSVEWAQSFGFDFSPAGTTNDVLAYIRQGRQPHAFVGWTKGVQVPSSSSSSLHTKYAEGLAYLFSNWMSGLSLEHCLQQYQIIMGVNGFSNHDSWRISGAAVMSRGVP